MTLLLGGLWKMNCNELLAKKSCKNKAKEKFVRTQTDGRFLYLDIKKGKKR